MNGGTGTISDQVKVKNTNLTLSSTTPTREGFEFQGWATSSTGSVVYAKGATYTANAGATLYAVWKDNQAPTLAIDKWTYVQGFTVENFSGKDGSVNVSSDRSELDLLSDGSYYCSEYTVNGGKWYVSGDGHGVASPFYTPNGGTNGTSTYMDYYRNPVKDSNSGYGYSANGYAFQLPVNTWGQFENATGTGAYGLGIDTVGYCFTADNYYSKATTTVSNYRFYSDNMHNSFYEIRATVDDNVGISAVKYISGDKTADNCISSGTAMYLNGNYYWYQVTTNGTYTVCVSDLVGNKTKKTIVIDKISNLSPTYPTVIPLNISELFATIDGRRQIYFNKVFTTSNGGNYTDAHGGLNSSVVANGNAANITSRPNGTTTTQNRAIVVGGANTFNLTESITSRWVYIELFTGYGSGNVSISDFRLKFSNGNSLTLGQAVNAGYISPFIVFNSSDPTNNSYWFDNLDTLVNTGSLTGTYAGCHLYIKVNNVYALTGISFTTDHGWNTYFDGVNIFRLAWTFDFSIGPFNTKNWDITKSTSLFQEGTTPSNYVTDFQTLGTIASFIRQTESGTDYACLKYSGIHYCLGKNFWVDTDTSGYYTKEKLYNDMKKWLGNVDLTCTYKSTEARCYLGTVVNSSYPNCNANSDGNVYCNDGSDYCGVYQSNGKWYGYCNNR